VPAQVSSQVAVQDAIAARVQTSTALAALLDADPTRRIYEAPAPKDRPAAYLTLPASAEDDARVFQKGGAIFDFTLHVWTRESGRHARLIYAALLDALTSDVLPLDAAQGVRLRYPLVVRLVGLTLDADGVTHHGVVSVTGEVEALP
jgi:hypothetical protein